MSLFHSLLEAPKPESYGWKEVADSNLLAPPLT
jgi:hypothetical protein